MEGYYGIYLMMFCFLLAWELGRKENRRLTYWAAWGVLILLFALMDLQVAPDAEEYMLQWDIIPTLSLREMLGHKFEIGYVLLCWVLERFFGSDRLLLVVLSLLILLPFARSYEDETEDPMVAMMAFVALGMYMHALFLWRQLAAMAILTLSHRFIRQRRFWPFLVTVLAAMTFHKTAVVFLPMYFLCRIPLGKWVLPVCAGLSVLLGLFGRPIIQFGIAYIYPRYKHYQLEMIGGETLLALLWAVTLLSWWLLRDRMDDLRVRLPFLMVLIGATIQPICFAFFWWLRIVLYFRVALVPMTAHLYRALFRDTEHNRALMLVQRYFPGLHRRLLPLYGKKWFRAVTLLLLFGVLFVWYNSELEGAGYALTPFH